MGLFPAEQNGRAYRSCPNGFIGVADSELVLGEIPENNTFPTAGPPPDVFVNITATIGPRMTTNGDWCLGVYLDMARDCDFDSPAGHFGWNHTCFSMNDETGLILNISAAGPYAAGFGAVAVLGMNATNSSCPVFSAASHKAEDRTFRITENLANQVSEEMEDVLKCNGTTWPGACQKEVARAASGAARIEAGGGVYIINIAFIGIVVALLYIQRVWRENFIDSRGWGNKLYFNFQTSALLKAFVTS
jgi:hypothetical protein